MVNALPVTALMVKVTEPMLKFLSLVDFARGRGMVLPSCAEILNCKQDYATREYFFDDGVLHSGMVLGGLSAGPQSVYDVCAHNVNGLLVGASLRYYQVGVAFGWFDELFVHGL